MSPQKPDEEKEEEDDKFCCGIEYYRRLITFFNAIFLISGLVLGALSIWTCVTHMALLSVISPMSYRIILYLASATAIFICLVSLLGALALRTALKSFTSIYLACVILTWTSEVLIGMLSYAYIADVRWELSTSLPKSIQTSYGVDEKFSEHVDFIQSRLGCCGANSPEDWNASEWRTQVWSSTIEAVPPSCCKTPTSDRCGLRIHPSSIAFTGCVHPISQHLQHRLSIFASVSIGFSGFLMLGIPFILGFFCKLHQRDTNRKERIRQRDLDNSRFTRNQHRFNLLNNAESIPPSSIVHSLDFYEANGSKKYTIDDKTFE